MLFLGTHTYTYHTLPWKTIDNSFCSLSVLFPFSSRIHFDPSPCPIISLVLTSSSYPLPLFTLLPSLLPISQSLSLLPISFFSSFSFSFHLPLFLYPLPLSCSNFPIFQFLFILSISSFFSFLSFSSLSLQSLLLFFPSLSHLYLPLNSIPLSHFKTHLF